MSRHLAHMKRSRASTARIAEVLSCEDDFTSEKADIGTLKNGGIKFQNVTFTYPGGSSIPAIP